MLLLVEEAGDGAASQLSVVGAHRHQLQQPTYDDAVVDDTAVSPHHLHQECDHSATKCRTQRDGSLSNVQRGRGTSPVVVGAVDAVGTDRRAHIVIDALRTAVSEDAEHRLRRLPTSQIICRIIQPSTAGCCSRADPTSGNRKPIIPVCDDRQWTSVTAAHTGLTNGDCRSCSRITTQCPLPALHRHVDANGNKEQ